MWAILQYMKPFEPVNFRKKMSEFRIINFIVGCSESNQKLVRAQLRDYVPKSISHVLFCLSRLTTLSMRCRPCHPDFRVLEWNFHSQSGTENRSRSGWMWMVSRQLLWWFLPPATKLQQGNVLHLITRLWFCSQGMSLSRGVSVQGRLCPGRYKSYWNAFLLSCKNARIFLYLLNWHFPVTHHCENWYFSWKFPFDNFSLLREWLTRKKWCVMSVSESGQVVSIYDYEIC